MVLKVMKRIGGRKIRPKRKGKKFSESYYSVLNKMEKQKDGHLVSILLRRNRSSSVIKNMNFHILECKSILHYYSIPENKHGSTYQISY